MRSKTGADVDSVWRVGELQRIIRQQEQARDAEQRLDEVLD